MGLIAWTLVFLASSLFWSWIIFWGGAAWLEGSFVAGLFVHFRAPTWTEEGIKIFAVLTWICEFIWFMIGLKSPEVRGFW